MSSLRGFLTYSTFICLLSLSKQHPVQSSCFAEPGDADAERSRTLAFPWLSDVGADVGH